MCVCVFGCGFAVSLSIYTELWFERQADSYTFWCAVPAIEITFMWKYKTRRLFHIHQKSTKEKHETDSVDFLKSIYFDWCWYSLDESTNKPWIFSIKNILGNWSSFEARSRDNHWLKILFVYCFVSTNVADNRIVFGCEIVVFVWNSNIWQATSTAHARDFLYRFRQRKSDTNWRFRWVIYFEKRIVGRIDFLIRKLWKSAKKQSYFQGCFRQPK